MADITDLAQYKKRKEGEGEEIYTCTGCGNEGFFLIVGGSIECNNCGSVINNLKHNGGNE